MPHYNTRRGGASSARAFTLIELLTVIAIIGILAAIIIPTVGKVRATAKNARCSATLREWGRTIMLYANDNKGTYTTRGANADGTPGSRGWQDAGQNPYTRYMTSSSSVTESTRAFRGCAMNPADQQVDYILCRGSVSGNIDTIAPDREKIPLNRASSPSQLVLMMDAVMNKTLGASDHYYVTSNTTLINTHVMPMFDYSLITSGYEESGQRHGGKSINAVFADGSVRKATGTPAGQGDRNSILEMRTVWFQIY